MPAVKEAKPERPRARRTLLPWMGGKSRSARAIVDRFPAHGAYVEVFCGGCAVLWAKPREKVEVINDRDGRLVGLLRVCKYHPDELLREAAHLTHSREEFADALAQPGQTDIQRAARFALVLSACFGGKLAGPTFGYSKVAGPGYSRAWLESLVAAARDRLERVTIERLDCAEVIQRYDAPHTLFYCDPPYPDTAGYAEPFDWSDHERLRAALEDIRGKTMVSLNDTPKVRALYAGWTMEPLAVPYTINRDKSAAPPARELLITRP